MAPAPQIFWSSVAWEEEVDFQFTQQNFYNPNFSFSKPKLGGIFVIGSPSSSRSMKS